MQNVRAWFGLALVTVVVWGMGSSAFAEPNWQEFWSGELGALGGGFVGASLCLFGRTPCEALMHKVLDQNVFQLTKKNPSAYVQGCGDYGLVCVFFGMNIGRALGASTGVVLSGSAYGVEGNILAAYIATGVWLVSSILLSKLGVDGNAISQYIQYMIIPGIPAALATIGYNIGAKMKSDKSKPAALGWYMPLIAVKF